MIPIGELRFRWFTSYWSYRCPDIFMFTHAMLRLPRNDMDTVGVRAGCTLTAYSDSSFNGDRVDIKAATHDR